MVFAIELLSSCSQDCRAAAARAISGRVRVRRGTMRARCQRSLFSFASSRGPSKAVFHELSCLMKPGWQSRVTRSNAWAARLTTPGSSSHRHSIRAEKEFGCARTRAATSSARPTEMRPGPWCNMERMDAGLVIKQFFAAFILCAMGRDKHLCCDAASAAQHLPDGPTAFGVGEEDFTAAADFRTVVPALEQGQMALANCRRW